MIKIRLANITAALTLAMLPLLSGCPTSSPSAPSDSAKEIVENDAPQTERTIYGVHAEENVVLTMRDGVVLTMDILRPALADGTPAPGPHPSILIQTPYGKANARFPYYVTRGYVQLIVEVRGTAGSGGINYLGSDSERQDSYDLVEWIATQPWSTGSVGTYGMSYVGQIQYLTAIEQPPHLKAIVPVKAPGDMYRTVMLGGQAGTPTVIGTRIAANNFTAPSGNIQSDPGQALMQMLARTGPIFQDSNLMLLTGGDVLFDGPFWRSKGAWWQADRIKVPALVVGGWFDPFARDAPLMFNALGKRDIPVRMLIGPWYHNNDNFGLEESGHGSYEEYVLRFFDKYLMGKEDPEYDNMPPVLYYRQGEGAYHQSATWPPEGVEYQALYLNTGAVPSMPSSLSWSPPSADGPTDYLAYQPAGALCSGSSDRIIGAATPDFPLCVTDQRYGDTLALTYDIPLDVDMVIEGAVAAQLFVSVINGQDAFVNVQLLDVSPDGSVKYLTGGWDTLSMRALDSDPEFTTQSASGDIIRPFHPYTEESKLPIEAGEVYELNIELWPVAARIEKGHSLRLAIFPADPARTSVPIPELINFVGSVLGIHGDAQHPNRIMLPINSDAL